MRVVHTAILHPWLRECTPQPCTRYWRIQVETLPTHPDEVHDDSAEAQKACDQQAVVRQRVDAIGGNNAHAAVDASIRSAVEVVHTDCTQHHDISHAQVQRWALQTCNVSQPMVALLL